LAIGIYFLLGAALNFKTWNATKATIIAGIIFLVGDFLFSKTTPSIRYLAPIGFAILTGIWAETITSANMSESLKKTLIKVLKLLI